MCQAGRAVALAVALAAIVFRTKAQDGDIAAGHAFAREACKACHTVEAEEGSSRMIVIGPAFRDIANTPGMTATAIRVFLTSSTPQNAKPDPHTGGDGRCERVYPQPPRSSLSRAIAAFQSHVDH
jgi:cytochrome c2